MHRLMCRLSIRHVLRRELRLRRRIRRRLIVRFRLEGGGVGSAIATLDKKA